MRRVWRVLRGRSWAESLALVDERMERAWRTRPAYRIHASVRDAKRGMFAAARAIAALQQQIERMERGGR